MTHFLTYIIDNPVIKEPAKTAPAVHKHFTRYSKGVFDGPIAKISQAKGGLSIGASFEYEDELFAIATQFLSDKEVVVKGKIIGSDNFKPYMEKLGLGSNWFPAKSKGETQNYNVEVEDEKVNVEALRNMAKDLPAIAYGLLNFASTDGSITLTMKKTPPRPNSKNPEESSKDAQLKFSVLKLPNTPEIFARVIAGLAKDFKDEIPSKFKSIIINNSYEITDLVLPTDKSIPSRDFRIHTVRKGILNRSCEIDGKSIVRKVNFVA
jgi:hypothetical protein